MFKKVSVITITLVALGLAACGGGGSGSSPNTTMTTTGSSGSSAVSGAKFDTGDVAGLGAVLVDARGRTVYILTSAGKKNVPCTDASGCTAVWPDLPLPSGDSAAKAAAGLNASPLGTMKLSDGETYPTYNGYLLYEYTGDTAAGQGNGQGIKSFGGTWHALDSSGQPATSGGGGY